MNGEQHPTRNRPSPGAKWDAGEPAFGMWATIGSPLVAELAAACGCDYVCVDLQHGLADEQAAHHAFQAIEAAGAVALARVAWNEPWLVMRALDLGAAGVIVPLVGSAGEAERAVAACRYPPRGIRSYGPLRAGFVADPKRADAAAERVLCFAMIETRDGLEHVEEIAATPGLDGVYIGPSDLSIALGLPPREGGAALEEAIVRVREACDRHAVIAGIHHSAGATARERAAAGFKLVTIGGDSRLLRTAIEGALAAARTP